MIFLYNVLSVVHIDTGAPNLQLCQKTPPSAKKWPLFFFFPKLNRRNPYVSFEKFYEVRIVLES